MPEINLKELFKEWNTLNTTAQESFGQFDFSKIKEIRTKQKIIEDSIYDVLKDNASEEIKSFLPDDCGQLEVGYDSEGNIFYFVMIDPESENDDKVKLIAITLDISKKVSLIKNFEIADS